MTDGHTMATLVESTSGSPRSHKLGMYTTLGRSQDNTIWLNDGAVSGHHAVIRRQSDGVFVLEDLGTTNGSFVGDEKITNQSLRDGDTIVLGSVALEFKLDQRQEESTDAPRGMPSRRPRLRTSSERLRQVKMRVSEEHAVVLPTLEIAADSDDGFFSKTGVDDTGVPFGKIRQDYERLLAAYELIHAIVGIDDLDEMLSRIVSAVMDLMSADRAAVLLVTSDGRLEPKVALQQNDSSEEFQVSTSILSYVVEHGSAVVCNDLGRDSRFSASESIIMGCVRSAMCVPMMHDGRLVGVLHLDSSLSTGAFQDNDLDVVRTIANTAAFCVESAMLKETIREMQRQQAEAMRAMISGASHFINNPLAVIRSNVTMFAEWSSSITDFHKGIRADPAKLEELYSFYGIDFIDEELGPMASETGTSADRIAAIVRALHMFEQKNDDADWSEFDLDDVIKDVMDEKETAISRVAQSHCQLERVRVRGVRERLRLLLFNVITNAHESISEGTVSENWVVASCHVSGSRVIVTIDDTGRGIAPERRTRIFAPFDTDRLDGPLGLGLAVAAEIARQHKAVIHVVPREGGGSRFIVDLPLTVRKSHEL